MGRTTFYGIGIIPPPIGHGGRLRGTEGYEQEQHVEVVACVRCRTGQVGKSLPKLIAVCG